MSFSRYKQLRAERLQDSQAQEWKKLGLCISCGTKIGWFTKRVNQGQCSSCYKELLKRANDETAAERKQEAENFKQNEYLRKKNNLPHVLKDHGLEAFVEWSVHEKLEIAGFAAWNDEESAAERIGGKIGVALLTGGFGSVPQTMPFGIVAISKDKLWRIEMGTIRSDLDFWTVPRDGRIQSLTLSELKSYGLLEEGGSFSLTLMPTGDKPLIASDSISKRNVSDLTLAFPHVVVTEHPFFEYFPDNEKIGQEISRIVAASCVKEY